MTTKRFLYLAKIKPVKNQLYYINNSSDFKFLKQSAYLFNFFAANCVKLKFALNNIYFTFFSSTQTFFILSVGIKKLKPSKRRLFFYSKLFFDACYAALLEFKKKNRIKYIFFDCIIPKKFRRNLINFVLDKAFAINFNYLKIFNGCQAKKKRRKKRLSFRSFK